jgi:Flp pilus assembly protein TadD
MTMTLAHPTDEDLGRFVEGAVDESERKVIVAHIADCNDCRIVVVDSAELVDSPATSSHRGWWIAVAAALILVVTGGTFTYFQDRDPLAKTKEDCRHIRNRPTEGLLSGFPFVQRTVNRGGNDENTEDPNLLSMQADAAEVAEAPGTSTKTVHARGVARLIDALGEKEAPVRAKTLNGALGSLDVAATREPQNAQYLSDLCAALIEAGRSDRRDLDRAVDVCSKAIRIAPGMPEALFNRAVALQELGKTDEATMAYRRYLSVDSSSPAAAEVRGHLSLNIPALHFVPSDIHVRQVPR